MSARSSRQQELSLFSDYDLLIYALVLSFVVVVVESAVAGSLFAVTFPYPFLRVFRVIVDWF